ncbi:MAG: hypothetical protein ACYCSR_10275 [Thiomonas sp.]
MRAQHGVGFALARRQDLENNPTIILGRQAVRAPGLRLGTAFGRGIRAGHLDIGLPSQAAGHVRGEVFQRPVLDRLQRDAVIGLRGVLRRSDAGRVRLVAEERNVCAASRQEQGLAAAGEPKGREPIAQAQFTPSSVIFEVTHRIDLGAIGVLAKLAHGVWSSKRSPVRTGLRLIQPICRAHA